MLPAMKTLQTSLLWVALWLAAASVLSAQTPVRITADNVNLRAKPLLTSEVVAQAHYDDSFVAREIGDEWIEIDAPPTVDLWVSKDFVKPDNTIGANRVNLRAGPSINYNIVDTLALGDTVMPRGEEISGWLKIAPPPSAHVWISREFVEVLSGAPPAEKMAEKDEKSAKKTKKSQKTSEMDEKTASTDIEKAPAVEKVTRQRKTEANAEKDAIEGVAASLEAIIPTPLVSPSTPAKDSSVREIPVPPPANLKLIPLEGQGRLTEVEGELRAAPLINEAPTRYRVVRWQNNRWQILCHVYGEASKFRSLQDKRVHLKGREYWIQGAAAPVLVPDQVQEAPAADTVEQ